MSGAGQIAEGDCVTMARRAATTRVPGRDERARDAAAAADERPRQGHGDSRPPPPDRGATAATAWTEGAVRSLRPGLPRGVATPTPRDVLRRVRLLVCPETILRWHRDL